MHCKDCLEAVKLDVDAAMERLEREIDILLNCADEEED